MPQRRQAPALAPHVTSQELLPTEQHVVLILVRAVMPMVTVQALLRCLLLTAALALLSGVERHQVCVWA